MIVIVDERDRVKEGYSSLFGREGVPSAGFGACEFGEWMSSAADEDLHAVGAILIGECDSHPVSPRLLREKTGAPVIALSPASEDGGHDAAPAANEQPADGESTEAAATDGTDDTARWLGGIGLVVGALGLGFGVGATLRARRAGGDKS